MDDQTRPDVLRPPRLEPWPAATVAETVGQAPAAVERPQTGPFEVLVGILLTATVLAGGVLTLVPADVLPAPVQGVGLGLVALGLTAGTLAVLVHARRAGLPWPSVLWRTVCAPFRLAFSLLP